MALKLFHESEFAQSRVTPEDQRNSPHPALLVTLVALWVAGAGNLALWNALVNLSAPSAGKLWLALDMALLIASCCTALLSLLCWRWTLKPAATVLLLLAAWGADVMLLSPAPISSALFARALQAPWQTVVNNGLLWGAVLLLVLALLPAALLWRMQLRRLSLRRNARHNGVLLLASGLLFAVAGLMFHQSGQHESLRGLFNPMALVHGFGHAPGPSIEQAALPR